MKLGHSHCSDRVIANLRQPANLFLLFISGLLLFSLVNAADNNSTVFGPEKFIRYTGKPVAELRGFSAADTVAGYNVRIKNGRDDGKQRVRSAVIRLNGEKIVVPSDMNRRIAELNIPVSLSVDNQLKVRLRGKPGSYLSISIVKDNSCAGGGGDSDSDDSDSDDSDSDDSDSDDSDSDDSDGGDCNTGNSAPVANAGADQTVLLGSTVQLDASASTDVDGDPLIYAWSFLTVPQGSGAVLSDPLAVMPDFLVDLPGPYIAELIVNDGQIDSAPDTVRIDTFNSPPVADAGPDQTVFVTDVVTLDGSASSDVDANPLTYQWTLTARPTGSQAVLTNANVVNPGFVADMPGSYTAQLVVNDGQVDSAPDAVIITTQNSKPVANAGPDQGVAVGATVQLDGNQSSDVDNDPLTYQWSLLTVPPGSTATLLNPAVVDPTFIADIAGMYIGQLIVDDGQVAGDPDTVVITASSANQSPAAVATASAVSVAIGTAVTLDGSGSSDPEGSVLTYAWTLTTPLGSSASLTGTTGQSSGFTPDVAGSYVVTLVVNDGALHSAPAQVTVTAGNQNNNPPDLLPPGKRTISVGQTFTTRLFAIDPDAGDTLTFSLPVAQTGMTINPATGDLAWTPGSGNLGMNTVTGQVTDSGGLIDTETFTIEVVQPVVLPPANGPPQLMPIADQFLGIGNTLALTASASDPDAGDILTFSLPLSPVGMSIDPATGAISWTPTVGQLGRYDMTVKVTDAAGAIAVRSAIVTVSSGNLAPFAVDDIYTADITQTLSIAANGVLGNDTDPDGDPLNAILVTQPQNGDLTLRADGSFDYVPRRPTPVSGNLPFVTDANLSLLAMPNFEPDAARRAGEALERTADGDVNTSGLPSFGRYQQVFEAEDVTVRRIEIFGNRELTTFDPVNEGIITLFDRSGVEIWNSGNLVFPAPNQDLVVQVNPPVPNVYRVQFDGTLFGTSTSGFTVFGEFNVYGDAHVQELPMVLEWAWNAAGRNFPTYEYVDSTPLVVDLNGDEIPEVIFSTGLFSSGFLQPGFLRIVDGRDGTDILTTPQCVEGFTSMAVGDIDGDGQPEIVAYKASLASGGASCVVDSPPKLIALEGDGTVAWVSDDLEGVGKWGGITLADLDGDGNTEILFGRQAISNTGKLLWTGAGSLIGRIPSVADIDLDGSPDVIIGSEVLNADGTLKWAGASLGVQSAVGNFDSDPYAEVFVIGANNHILYEHDGTIKWFGQGGFGGGPPTVGDFDGDGQPEIGIAGAAAYRVYETDGTLKWLRSITDSSSGVTGSSLFDFDGDGRMEVVQRDQEYFRIWDGATGNVRFRTPLTSVTANELPLVADVDGDGQAEVVVPSTLFGKPVPGRPGGVYVFGGRDNNFVRARPIWNQHDYHVTNVNADGTIPADEPENWLVAGLNNHRVNDFLPGEKDRADQFTYRANDGALDSNDATVFIDIVLPNSGPIVTSSPVLLGSPGFDYFYDVQATDKDRDPLTFTLTVAPSGMTIDAATGLIRWQPTNSDLGTHQVILDVDDGRGLQAGHHFMLTIAPPVRVPDIVGQAESAATTNIQSLNLAVGQKSSANHPLVAANLVAAQTPSAGSIAQAGSKVDYTLSLGPLPADIDNDGDNFTENQGDCNDTDPAIFPGATDIPGDGIDQDCDGSDAAVPPASILVLPANTTLLTGEVINLTATGINNDGTSRNLTGLVNWSAGPGFSSSTAGTFTVSASLGGVSGSASVDVVSRVSGDAVLPVAAIMAPVSGATVTEPVDVTGTATDANFLKYELAYAIAGDTNFTTLATSTSPVTNGVLGQFDPTVLINDQYTIRLTVYDTGGSIVFTETTVQVDENLKVGNFTLTFNDLQIPMSGIPITVNRMYDSRDKRRGDFGVGWRLDVQSLRIRSNRVPGSGWEVLKSGLAYGLFPTDEHKVTLTLGGGRVEEFDLVVSPGSSALVPFPPFANRASFSSRPGTLGTLTSLDNNNLTILDLQPGVIDLLDDITNTTYNPDRFRYTSVDGTEIVISKSKGVESIKEPNGNTLTFTPNGIFHSAGKQALFVRDALGRITKITDPNGGVQTYVYDGNDDLTSHTDREGNQIQYKYNHMHGLITIIGANGNPVTRNEYDNSGRLLRSLDANGNAISYGHNLNARQEVITDRLGAITVLEFDARGNIITKTDAAGNMWQFSYDLENNQTSKTDPNGGVWLSTYDVNGRLLSYTDPLGNKSLATYDQTGRVLSRTDPGGNTTQFKYDSNGDLTETIDPLGNNTKAVYDSVGNRISTTDKNGNITTFTHNSDGLITSIVDPQGHTIQYGYDALGNNTQTTYPFIDNTGTSSVVWDYTFDANGNLTQSFQPGISTPSVVGYDNNQQPSTGSDPLGNSWGAQRNIRGEIDAMTSGANTILAASYDAEGRRTSINASDFGQAQRTFDLLGNETSLSLPGTGTSSSAWNSLGKISSETDPAGNTTTLGYDAAGRLALVTFPDATFKSTAYDAVGNIVSSTNEAGESYNYGYDALGRLNRLVQPDGMSLTAAYDANDNLVQQEYTPGEQWTYSYNLLDQIINTTDPLGNTFSYTYDSLGIPKTITTPLGKKTTYVYDKLGRLGSHSLPEGQSRQFTYDALGRITTAQKFNGDLISFTYDDSLRTLKRDSGGNQDVVSFDSRGQITGYTTASGTTGVVYDGVGRLQQWQGMHGTNTSYSRDSSGRVSNVISTQGNTMLAYNAVNALSSISFGSDTTIITRNSTGLPVSTLFANGLQANNSYDPVGRALQVGYSQAGNMLLQMNYTYDNKGRITALIRSDGVASQYSYNAMGRLTGETISDGSGNMRTASYQYDADGNVNNTNIDGNSRSYIYDKNDRLLDDGLFQYGWDANGNLVSRTSVMSAEQYSYDSHDRLVSYTRAGSGQTQIDYSYDHDGLIHSRTLNGNTTYYSWDRTNAELPVLLEELDASGNLLRRYFHDGLFITHSIDANGAATYYLRDHHGTVLESVDANGAVSNKVDYDAYGNLLSGSPSVVGFTNAFTDTVSGFVFMRSRWYSPGMRRFIHMDSASPDPLRTTTFNRYTYSAGDPVNRFDPTGQSDFTLASVIQTTFLVSTVASLSHITYLNGGPAGVIANGFGLRKINNGTRIKDAEFAPLGVSSASAGVGNFGLTVGREILNFIKLDQSAAYIFFGPELSLVPAGTATKLVGTSTGLSVKGISSIYNTPTPEHYSGYFFSFSGSLAFLKFGGKGVAGASGAGFWSPVPTYTVDANNPNVPNSNCSSCEERYSHGFRIGGGKTAVNVSFSITLYLHVATFNVSKRQFAFGNIWPF